VEEQVRDGLTDENEIVATAVSTTAVAAAVATVVVVAVESPCLNNC
jgi:hypothetical protein